MQVQIIIGAKTEGTRSMVLHWVHKARDGQFAESNTPRHVSGRTSACSIFRIQLSCRLEVQTRELLMRQVRMSLVAALSGDHIPHLTGTIRGGRIQGPKAERDLIKCLPNDKLSQVLLL